MVAWLMGLCLRWLVWCLLLRCYYGVNSVVAMCFFIFWGGLISVSLIVLLGLYDWLCWFCYCYIWFDFF